MAVCLIHRFGGASFKAYIQVTATPGSFVTCTGGGKTFTGTAGTDGEVTIIVKKKATYSVTSNASGSQTASVEVTTKNITYTTNIVGRFTVTFSAGTGSTLGVSRSSSPYAGASTGALTSGSYVYYGDILTTSGGASTGFGSYNVSYTGSTKNGSNYTITDTATFTASATPITYKLTISAGTGTSITCNRTTVGTAGTAAGVSTGNIGNNANIYYGDIIKITTAASNTAYNTPTLKVDNAAFTSGSTKTVGTANMAVSATTSVKSYKITISASNSSVTANRTSSPYGKASTGNLSNNATVYYGDVIKITFTANTYYTIATHTVNGSTFTSGNSHTTTGNVTIVSTATRQTVKIKFTRVTGSGTSTQRFVGEIPINKGDSLSQSVNKSASGTFVANAGTTHTGTYRISKADAGSTSFRIYFLNNAGSYSAQRDFSSSSIGNNSTAITSDKSFS